MSIAFIMSLVKGLFAIEGNFAKQAHPYVQSILKGEVPEGNYPGFNEEGTVRPYAKHATAQGTWDIATDTGLNGWDKAPKNSVAVIPIQNAIMKHDYCGMYGMITVAKFLEMAYAHPNICGVVIDMDSPGGEVYGTRTISEMIASSPKPVVTCVNDGMMASAGYYIGSKSSAIVSTSPTDWIGSIGVYWTLVNPKGAYEKEGYQLIEVYSPDSPDKNKDIRDAFEGKTAGIAQSLKVFDKYFMESVKQGRGDKLDHDALKGGMFFANEAKDAGLIDDIMSFQDAIELCTNMSGKAQVITFS